MYNIIWSVPRKLLTINCTYLFSNMLVKEMNKSSNFFWYIVCIRLRFYSRIKAIHLTYNTQRNKTTTLKFSSNKKKNNPVFLKWSRYLGNSTLCTLIFRLFLQNYRHKDSQDLLFSVVSIFYMLSNYTITLDKTHLKTNVTES